MTPKLYKAADVCEIAQLQPYVLRSWEKEFPGIGVQKSPEGPRLYRQSDLDQVLRIKQLVFSEGLTLSGARRRLEDEGPAPADDAEMSEVIEVLGADAHKRIAHVRNGLRSLLLMLDGRGDQYALTAPPPGNPAGSERNERESMASHKVVAVRAKSATKRVSRAR